MIIPTHENWDQHTNNGTPVILRSGIGNNFTFKGMSFFLIMQSESMKILKTEQKNSPPLPETGICEPF